jgi:toxin YhaV
MPTQLSCAVLASWSMVLNQGNSVPMIVNGWALYYFRIFKAALDELEAVVTQLAQNDPGGYKTHPKTKLLASVYKAITEVVPTNPDAPEFRLGKTLGSDNTNWRRVKKGMPDRYRLFFRFASSPVKVIVYVWFNDEDTLRKAGSKTDVYETFRRMLTRGVVAGSISVLLENSVNPIKAPE